MKLAVCDLDGTLLEKNETRLKKNIFDLIGRLKNKGVLFACASGRTHGELYRIFEGADIIYISSDGALISENNKTIFEKVFEKQDLEYFFGFENVVFHSKFISYVKTSSKMLQKQLANEYRGHIVSISSRDEIASSVNKITVISENFKADEKYARIYDGKSLSDYAPKGTDKGSAVEFLCKNSDIEKEDLFVVGDNLNDIPMLSLTENSFCVKNSKYNTKKVAKHETLSGESFLSYLDEIL